MTDPAESPSPEPVDLPENPEPDEYDVVVIGTGSAGKPLAGELARAGLSVLAIEQALVGGECAYLACIPSKAMLLAAREYRSRPDAVEAGAGRPDRAAFAVAVETRDRITRHRDDSAELADLEKDGVSVLRGSATLSGRTVLITAANGEDGARGPAVRWRRALVLATGAQAVLPPIDGLAEARPWTSPDALSSAELPDRLAILGGGAIGCELAQVYAGFGSRVTLIEASATLLPREAPWVGEAMAEALRQAGVQVRTATKAGAVTGGSGPITVRTTDDAGTGAGTEADRLLVAVGKRPRTSGYGLATLGITARKDGALDVDARCRVIAADGPLPDVFAIGDVTALAPYTHTANYHARIVAAHLLGHGVDADHTGIPRVVYTDPPVFCTGETEAGARERGARVFSANFDVCGTSRSAVERTLDSQDHRPAQLELVADADTGVLLGASAIGPEADSWAAELALAVRTRTTVHTLAQALHAFPSWTEAIHPPARKLSMRIAAETRPERDSHH